MTRSGARAGGVRSAPLPVISLFSGGLGLDLGLERAGFKTVLALDSNPEAVATIRRNRPNLPVISCAIEDIPTAEILEAAGLKPGGPLLISGGPCCQAFSTAGQRGSLDDPRGLMFREFLRVVREARPSLFVMENVRGILSAAVRHRRLAERGPGHPPLAPEEELGSALARVLKEFSSLDYYTLFGLVNAADFGVPQTRERVLFIGSRDGHPLAMPAPTHSRGGRPQPWVTLGEALRDLQEPAPAFRRFSPAKEEILRHVPPGGNWRNLPEDLQERALGGAFTSWGGRTGFYRRLSWERPAPALTTRPDSKATMACHPTELRPLSVGEYARLQQFPADWVFAGSTAQQYRLAGNAVPLGLAEAVGRALLAVLRLPRQRALKGTVRCWDRGLAERLDRLPKTVLNPPRMRKVRSTEALRQWLGAGRRRKLGAVLPPAPGGLAPAGCEMTRRPKASDSPTGQMGAAAAAARRPGC